MGSLWQQQQPSPGCDGPEMGNDMIKEYESLLNTPSKVSFKYIAEGRANAVFAIYESSQDRGRFARILLRVPKTTPGITPCDYASLQIFHTTRVARKVGPAHLVPQVLIRISAHVADALHALRQEYRGVDESVINPGYAMLIQDMSAEEGFQVLEFKPKWLAQSPLAPAGAKRCRTCAREASRLSQGKGKGVPICPLGLVHEDPVIMKDTIRRLAPEWSAADQERLVEAFEKSGILRRLRDLQVEGDPGRGLLEDPSDPGFGLAMTLRDCSCYVRLPLREADGEVEIKIADVDKKNWEDKQTYWREFHQGLVEGGWYTGEEAGTPVETKCVLG